MTKTWRFPPLLRRILKYSGVIAAIVFLLFGIASWIVFQKKNEWLLSQIQKQLHESQSGHLEVAFIDLKLFKSFPDITIELDSISYYEHHDSLRTPEEKPILYANQLFVALEFIPLIHEELKISEISLSDGQLNIIEYPGGQLNITRALLPPAKPILKAVQKKSLPSQHSPTPKEKKVNTVKSVPPSPQKAMQIDLQFVSLKNITIIWNSSGKQKPSIVLVNELEADISDNEKVKEATVTSSIQVQSVQVKHTTLPSGELSIRSKIQYEQETQQINLNGEFGFDELSATVQGTYAHQKNQFLNLEIDASSSDLELLSLFIKPEILKKNPDILKQGDIYAKAKITGPLKAQAPQVEVTFGMRDLSLQLPRHIGAFDKVGFEGRFSSGNLPDYSQATFEIKNLRGKLPGGFLKGDFRIQNFIDPQLKYDLDALVKLDGYDQIFNINFLKELTGSVLLQANFNGPLKDFSKHSMDSVRSSKFALNDLAFIVAKTNLKVSGLSGIIENKNNQATIQQLKFAYGRNDLLLNVTIDNFMYLLFKGDVNISASGNIQSSQLFTQDFIFDTTSNAYVQDRISNFSLDFQLETAATKDTLYSAFPDVSFTIQKLSATLDELPDLKMITGKGVVHNTRNGLKLDLQEFHATMPQGKLDASGDLLIREPRLWEFNARVNANKFPWNYVKELAAEISTDAEPSQKNLPVKKMDLFTVDLDVSAEIITYPFDFKKLILRNTSGNFHPADSKTLSVEKLDVALSDLSFIHPENSGSITGLKSTLGSIKVKQLRVPGLNALDIDMEVAGHLDTLNIAFSSANQKEKSEHGNLSIDLSQKERGYQLQYQVKGTRVEYFIQKYYKKDLMRGEIDYELDLRSHGNDWTTIKQNLAGEIEVTGDSIDLKGVDIDNVLKKFERSQNFNLADLGAVLVAGPVGLAVTKGTDFVSLAAIKLNPKHHTYIQTLQAKWKLENRQLITEDVALATLQNRIAFNGSIDMEKDSIPGLTIAVIDKNGCALMDQKLYGSTKDLKTGKLNITKTLFGSVINFANAIIGKDCKPVYTGNVKHPISATSEKQK